jgi:hypothetical protein
VLFIGDDFSYGSAMGGNLLKTESIVGIYVGEHEGNDDGTGGVVPMA